MTKDEEWRVIARNPNYEVSNFGQVRRATPNRYGRDLGRIVKAAVNTHGYLFVGLTADRKNTSTNVHSLVCEAFHGPKPTPKHEVAHGDGDQTNNRANNLRWATRKENFADRDAHGRTARGPTHFTRTKPEAVARGERHGCSKLTAAEVIAIRAAPRGLTVVLAQKYGVSQAQISDIRTGKSWRHLPLAAAA